MSTQEDDGMLTPSKSNRSTSDESSDTENGVPTMADIHHLIATLENCIATHDTAMLALGDLNQQLSDRYNANEPNDVPYLVVNFHDIRFGLMDVFTDVQNLRHLETVRFQNLMDIVLAAETELRDNRTSAFDSLIRVLGWAALAYYAAVLVAGAVGLVVRFFR
ncbi:hypothetical protein GGR57DRAFT_272365 [Xylariaceae sp. FL1272]|nr:hypothetical protein GGR57DRAFT_272365 [Xylariaceae sp. FL1272]